MDSPVTSMLTDGIHGYAVAQPGEFMTLDTVTRHYTGSGATSNCIYLHVIFPEGHNIPSIHQLQEILY
jgi:hypothetical protein